MKISLDGQVLFDEQQLKLEVGSFSRDSVERTVSGLDGVLSIDLGGRGRKIKQKGQLRAVNRSQMNEIKEAISAYMDGACHRLQTSESETFDNVRLDSFRIVDERFSGVGLVVDYEIVYTQLAG